MVESINLESKLDLINEYWDPKIVGELNGQYVKLAKFKGEFDMHHHANEDELFYVIKGVLEIELEDKTVIVRPGEFVTIPRGVDHKPIAREEVHVMLFEPASTKNTGNIINEKTKVDLDRI